MIGIIISGNVDNCGWPLSNFSFPLFLSLISKINMSSKFKTAGCFKDWCIFHCISRIQPCSRWTVTKSCWLWDQARLISTKFSEKILCVFRCLCFFASLTPTLWKISDSNRTIYFERPNWNMQVGVWENFKCNGSLERFSHALNTFKLI